MRSHIRTFIVLALAAGLVALFLRQVDLASVAREIRRAEPFWLAVSLGSMFLNLVVRSLRWRYLLEPIGSTSFANAFRATAVGFAARGVLPSAAGELVRPYFLSRYEPVSATGAFATVLIERLLDMLPVLLLLAWFVFVSGRDHSAANPTAFAVVTWAAAITGVAGIGALVLLFLLAGRPERIERWLARMEELLPAKFAGAVAGAMEKFVG